MARPAWNFGASSLLLLTACRLRVTRRLHSTCCLHREIRVCTGWELFAVAMATILQVDSSAECWGSLTPALTVKLAAVKIGMTGM